MKREPSSVTRSLRAASVVITVVSLVAFSTIAYSLYSDVNAVIGTLGSGPSEGVATSTVLKGTNATIYINATVPNAGLYPLSVGLSCLPSNGSIKVSCSNSSVTVAPGGQQTLRFTILLQNLSLTSPNNFSVEGNLSLSLIPFGSASLKVPIGTAGGNRG